MRRKFFSFSLMASVGLLVFSFGAVTACNANNVQIASVKMDISSLSLKVGEYKDIKASVSPKDFLSTTAYWVSTNENVAIVDEYGRVFAVGVGQCQIHCYIGGGRAICNVSVDKNGDVPVDQPSLRLVPASKTIQVNEEFDLSYVVNPTDTLVTFVSSAPSVASVSTTGHVKGLTEGSATITASGTNGKTATSIITVTTGGGGGDDPEYPEYGYGGNIKIGAPLNQQDFMKGLCSDFNRLTKSNINFTVVAWEEDKSADNMSDPATGPDIYPFVSDQTLRLYSRNAITKIPNSHADWIEEDMGTEALEYATLAGVNQVIGYPFTSDNGYVMFYDKSVVSEAEIDEIDKLFDKADALGYEVDFDLANGYYSAGTFMTYNNGKSLYKLTARDDGTPTVKTSFNSEAGLNAARLMAKLFGEDALMGSIEVPTAANKVLATITDTSKIAAFKAVLGSNYAAAPLPFTDSTRTTRLGVYLGYKCYGVNGAGRSKDKLDMCFNICKFMSGKYAQEQRFRSFFTKPTLTSLQSIAAFEPHIAALNAQALVRGCIPQTAVETSLWSQTADAAQQIQQLGPGATDAQLKKLLQDLDDGLSK
ncbi:MAG: extracellular solute-binding protein [Bacilli bacterium]|nr:extracellular solute-binding protein [Bacilli bacterium]